MDFIYKYDIQNAVLGVDLFKSFKQKIYSMFVIIVIVKYWSNLTFIHFQSLEISFKNSDSPTLPHFQLWNHILEYSERQTSKSFLLG